MGLRADITGWWQRLPVRRQLIIATLVGTVPLILLGLALLAGRYVARRDAVLQQNLAEARLASVYVGGVVEGDLRTLLTLARANEVQTGTPADVQGLVDRQSQANPSWETLFVANAAGEVMASNVPATATIAGLPYFAQARATRQPVVTNQVASPLTGSAAVVLAEPITRNGAFGGIVAATITVEGLAGVLDPLGGTDAAVSLWGNDGVRIATASGTSADLLPADHDRVLRDGTGSAVVRDPASGARRLIGFAPVPQTPWTMVTSTPLALVLAPVYRDALLYLGISTLVVVFALAWAGFAAGVFAEQVRSLATRAREIGAGDLTPHPPAGLGGEMADLEESLERMATSLAMFARMRADLLSLVSHELKTPLTSIHASLDLLRSGLITPDQPQYREVVDIAARQTNRLQDMVDNLLNVARLQSGGIIVAVQPTRLRPLVETAVAQHADEARDRGLAVHVDVPDDLRVLADPARVTLALSNLLDNAVRFTETGEVTVRAWREDDFVATTIADTGVGIPSEVMASLFDPLRRYGPVLTRPNGGAGLGLPVVKAVVEAHGGTITVDSAPGAGTTVTFTLPAA